MGLHQSNSQSTLYALKWLDCHRPTERKRLGLELIICNDIIIKYIYLPEGRGRRFKKTKLG